MAEKLTPQQKLIFEQMRTYEELVDHKKVASDMGLSVKGVLSQLHVLTKAGLVAEPEEHKFQVAEDAQEKLDEMEEDTTVTMADLNLTPKQFFERIGRTWGVNPERLRVMTDMIWQSGDPENLDHVWISLGKAQVSPDIKRFWVTAWQAFLGQEKPELLNWQPPTHVDEKVDAALEKREVQRRVEEAVEDGPKEYVIDVRKNEPVKVGEGIGLYSLKEAKELVNVRLMNQMLGGKTQEVASEKVSEILSALGPYINKEGKEGTETMALMRELFEEKLTAAIGELAARLPQDGGEKKPWYEVIPQMAESIKTLGPVLGPLLRDALGLPPPGAVAVNTGNNNPQQQTPIQMVDQNGNPLVINLGDLLQLRKFDADQKREDDKHKASMDMMSGLRGFMDKIGTAAARMAGERK